MAFELRGVARTVGGEVHVHPTDLCIERGSFTVLLGPTRAGKTSLLRLLAGLDRPHAGRVLVDGEDVTGRALRRRRVAMVYQEFINYPNLTVAKNIASPMRRRGVPRAEVPQRVREVARLVRIDPYLDRHPGELSGGQQQRLAIARALAMEAELLLLDEPLVNLDLKLREELREELREVLAQQDTTIVYATSEPQEALAMGGTTALVHEGGIVQRAAALEAYHRPATALAGRLFSDPPMNQWAVRVESGRARLSPDCRFPLPAHLAGLADGDYVLGLRAHHAWLIERPGTVPIEAEVDLVEVNGSETFVHGRHGDLAFVVQEEGAHHHPAGSVLTCHLDPRRMFAFAPGGEGELVGSYRAEAT